MGLIERAAGLIEPVERNGTGASAPATRNTGLVERTADVVALDAVDARDRAAQSDAEQTARELHQDANGAVSNRGADSPILRVNRAHLQRQGLITPDGSRTANAESFRRIKRYVLAATNSIRNGIPGNLVMVTSALAGEGKTFCSVSLATSIALELDRTVLLVDADVAKPSVPSVLGVKAERGLLDLLVDPNLTLPDVMRRTDLGKLTFLPAGTPHPHATELLASSAMKKLLMELASRYRDRVIVFDSPPLLAASESSVLASQMGQIVVVVEACKTSEGALKSALGRVDAAKITGLLLNKGDNPGLRYHYGEYGKVAK